MRVSTVVYRAHSPRARPWRLSARRTLICSLRRPRRAAGHRHPHPAAASPSQRSERQKIQDQADEPRASDRRLTQSILARLRAPAEHRRRRAHRDLDKYGDDRRTEIMFGLRRRQERRRPHTRRRNGRHRHARAATPSAPAATTIVTQPPWWQEVVRGGAVARPTMSASTSSSPRRTTCCCFSTSRSGRVLPAQDV